MDQTIDTRPAGVDTVEEFYDRLASDYDAMTTFEKRFIQEEPFFRLLVKRYQVGSALDAGCGTGFHSILLARLGVRVTAVDISSRMLAELARHTAGLGMDIRTVQARFADLPARVNGSFDAVFCLGNTLAHLLTEEEMRSTLLSFAHLLTPGGILFTQVVNFDRILRARAEVQSVKQTNRGTFTRSYEYPGDAIRFTIRKSPAEGGSGEERIQTVELRPVRSAEFSALLSETGFEDVRTFGSVAMEEYDPVMSKDLVVLARRVGG